MSAHETLLAYKQWADARLLDDLAELPGSALRERAGLPFDGILATLCHMHRMDLVWRAHLLGHAHGETSREPADVPPLGALAAQIRALDAWFVEHARSLSRGELEEARSFAFIDGGAGRMTRGEMLLHVANHATYHRGHVSTALRSLGHAHRSTDLPVFLRERTVGASLPPDA